MSILGFFVFVQQLARILRSTSMMQLVANRGRSVIAAVYPHPWNPARPEQARLGALPDSSPEVVELSGRSGVVMAFSVERLVQYAREANAIVELVPQVGDFVATGDPLFRIFGGDRPLAAKDLRGCVAIGFERTMEQDPRFVFRILVDIATRALSPAVNDPTTAVLALDQIHDLLLCLGRHLLDDGRALDQDGKIRLVYGTPDWPDYVVLGVSEIRQYGSGSLQVDRRLRALLEHLLENLPEARHPPVRQELELLQAAIERHFHDPEDRKRGMVGDFQGVGGSKK
jgi:uncharacterized membrane protein